MKVNTTISLDEEILEGAKSVAKSERRSLSAQIETWIAETLSHRAVTPAETEPSAHHEVPEQKKEA